MFFLEGKIANSAVSGGYAKNPDNQYVIYLRDQVGWFEDTDTLSISPNPSSGVSTMISDMNHADQNSGWCLIKYPIYRSDDNGKMESDYALIRLAEIYYSLAEIKFKQGDKAGAAKLLNTVRSRYYPEGSSSLYKIDGSQITKQELLDEWGREFLAEKRRRTDLNRFGLFTTGIWWDKQPSDSYRRFYPIPARAISANPLLKRSEGYIY